MVRTLRWLAGAVFGLVLAALIPFWIEKGAVPRGNAVLGILYIVLGLSLVVWLIAVAVVWRGSSRRPKPLEIIYSLDGSSEMRVPFRSGRPQSLLISVGLRNPNPYNLDGVAINSLFPQGLQVERCGAHGESLENSMGHWLSTPERLPDEPPPGSPKNYWAAENMTIAGNGSKLLFFKIRLTQPRALYLLTRVFGNVKEAEQAATLQVIETDHQFLEGIVNELICDGEALAAGPKMDFGPHAGFQCWKEELIFATAALNDEDRDWWDSCGRDRLSDHRNSIEPVVRALYDLRRRLG